MNDPIAFFLTWPTYGTWLPGDSRGWVEYRNGWHLPDTAKFRTSKVKLKESVCKLNHEERILVEKQVAETCHYRDWKLHAVSCRSNHMHLVVGAEDTKPEKIHTDIKAWSTRKLKELSKNKREHWWAERGSQRYIYDEESLATVVKYVSEAQERKDRDP
ncbi:MAG: transposase [Pirellulales bacterium]